MEKGADKPLHACGTVLSCEPLVSPGDREDWRSRHQSFFIIRVSSDGVLASVIPIHKASHAEVLGTVGGTAIEITQNNTEP